MIAITCDTCGARYKAPDELAGRSLNCKRCGTTLDILPAGADPIPYALADAPAEPSPAKPPPDDELQSTFRPTRDARLAEPDRAAEPGSGTGTKPRRKGKGKRRRKRKPEHPSDLPEIRGWVIGGLVVALSALGALAYFNPGARVAVLFVTFLIGLTMAVGGNMTLADRVLDEDVFLYWVFLVVPYYAIYYIVTRWEEVRGPLAVSVVGYVLTLGSMILITRTVF